MLQADLYEQSVSLESYLSAHDCQACGFADRQEFLVRLKEGKIRPESCRISKERLLALHWAARPETLLPPVEVLQMPNPGPCGLYPINEPDEASSILVSGNSQLTIEVLSAVLSTTTSSFWYLVADTQGHTVDMALVYKIFTADVIEKAFKQAEMDINISKTTLFLPGLAKHLCEELGKRLHFPVKAGPVCAAELPLFFGAVDWQISIEQPGSFIGD